MRSPLNPRRTDARPAPSLLLCALAAALASVLSAATARAQQQPLPPSGPDNSLLTLQQRRAELSRRAIEEPVRRRLEEGKPLSGPADPERTKSSARPGVVRAVPPEERKALAHTEKGLAYFSKQKFDEAIKEYAAAIRLQPSLAPAHNNLGSAYFALSRYDEALASFRQAVQLEPDYAQAHLNVALAYHKLGREQETNAALLAAARAYLANGDEHLAADRFAEAEAAFKELLKLDPAYPPARLKLGLLYNSDRRFREAATLLEQLAREHPRDADAHEALAESLHGLGRHADSLQSAARATQLRPDAPGPHYIAGLAHAALGDRDKALASHAKLLELKADDYARLLHEAIEKKTPGKK
jgi:tetratricopeptide (TPR) repeat protein